VSIRPTESTHALPAQFPYSWSLTTAKHMNDLLAAPPAVETPAVGPPAPTDERGEDQPAPVQEPARGDDQADDGGNG
jgi:hypothetical protein